MDKDKKRRKLREDQRNKIVGEINMDEERKGNRGKNEEIREI